MARISKPGFDYFPLDTQFADDKIDLLEVDEGLQGFAILVKLWQQIYRNEGYFTKWDIKARKIFIKNNALTMEELDRVTNAFFENGLFDLKIFNKFEVLTSRGVQRRYLKMCKDSRRKTVIFIKEYLLSEVENDLKEVITELIPLNAELIDINATFIPQNAVLITQSKVKESKVKESIPEELIPELIPEEYISFFEEVWNLYPKKKGKSDITKKVKKDLFKIGNDLKIAVENYKQEIRINQTEEQYIKYGSTFFKGGYVDYLPENYQKPKQGKTNFNNYDQRQTNYDNVIMGWTDDSDS